MTEASFVTMTLTVNGETISANVATRRSLIDFLREDLGLTGGHVGCEHGVCGACTVVLNGRIIRGCLTFAVQARGQHVETIEGATATGRIRHLQTAFYERAAVQCGFCTPGMLLTAAELLEINPAPTRDEIRAHLAGNYCRCTGYQAIVDAVEAAAASLAKVRNDEARATAPSV
jgi:carbon-monoxide dehydrogenase small subunit